MGEKNKEVKKIKVEANAKPVKQKKQKKQGELYLRAEMTTAILYTIIGSICVVLPTICLLIKKIKGLPKFLTTVLNASGMNICYAFAIATGVILICLAIFGFIAIVLEKDRYKAA